MYQVNSIFTTESKGKFIFALLTEVFKSFFSNYRLRAEIPVPEINQGEKL